MDHSLFDQRLDERPVGKLSFSRAALCMWVAFAIILVGNAIELFDPRQRTDPSPWMIAFQVAKLLLMFVGVVGAWVGLWNHLKALEAQTNARFRGWSKRSHVPCPPDSRATE